MPDGDYAGVRRAARCRAAREPGAIVDARRARARAGTTASIASPSASARASASRRRPAVRRRDRRRRANGSSVGPRDALERTTLDGVRRELDRGRAARLTHAGVRADPAPPRGRRGDASRRSPTVARAVVFDAPQPAVTPGQAVVFYDGRRGGRRGWIGDVDAEVGRREVRSTERPGDRGPRNCSDARLAWPRARLAEVLREALEVALGVDGRHAARAGRGDRLAVDVILHVAAREDARPRSSCVPSVRDDVAVGVDSSWPAKSRCSACGRWRRTRRRRRARSLAGLEVAQHARR